MTGFQQQLIGLVVATAAPIDRARVITRAQLRVHNEPPPAAAPVVIAGPPVPHPLPDPGERVLELCRECWGEIANGAGFWICSNHINGCPGRFHSGTGCDALICCYCGSPMDFDIFDLIHLLPLPQPRTEELIFRFDD